MTLRREWTSDLEAALRVLWTEGLSTAAIGRRLNISKNAVIGKAHRMELPARPSPIKTGGKYADLRREYARQRASREAVQAVVSVLATPEPPEAVKPSRGRVEPCCWVEGVKGSWRYCDAPSVPNAPYCQEHFGKAYVRTAPATQAPAPAR